jgi:hypothetical protein
MIGEASAAIGSIKAAIEIAKGASGLNAKTDINLAVIEIQRALLEAQSAAFDDREKLASQNKRIAELEAELSQVHSWEADKARYKLTETATGVLVYALKPECVGDEPDHRLCVRCYNEGRKSVLQVRQRHSGGESVECQHCEAKMTLSPFPKVQINQGIRRSSWMG